MMSESAGLQENGQAHAQRPGVLLEGFTCFLLERVTEAKEATPLISCLVMPVPCQRSYR
jgi:hypothetical protein